MHRSLNPDETPSESSTPDSDLLEEACGADPGWICERIYDATGGNDTVAGLSVWFIDRPLTIVLILVAAWIVSRIARRAIVRLATQAIQRKGSFGRRGLETLGLGASLLVENEEETEVKAARVDARAQSISAVLGSSVVVVVWTIALFLIVGELGINLAPLLASAGIAGVALGFGAQSLVKDCITGLFILIEDQYGIGDVVDLGEAIGVVEEIDLRTTVLRSLNGTVWHVPNGEIVRVGNMSQLWSVALVDVDVAYDTDLDRAQDVVMATARNVCDAAEWDDHIVEEPQLLGVERLGADGVTLRLIVKCSPGQQWGLQRSLRKQIKIALDQAGIEIPFPQRTIWVRRDTTERAESDR